jgi:hypothetical protein
LRSPVSCQPSCHKETHTMSRLTAILVLIVATLSAFAKDANGRALNVDGGRELNGKYSGSKFSRSKSGKGSKSRRALDLDGEGNLEFDELELNEPDVNGVEILVFEGDCELNGKSGKYSGSKSGKSRLWMSMALTFLIAIVSSKASPVDPSPARAGGQRRSPS